LNPGSLTSQSDFSTSLKPSARKRNQKEEKIEQEKGEKEEKRDMPC
jgi:hypothetical protein